MVAVKTLIPDNRARGLFPMREFDLDAYLARVGYDGPRTPTLDTLRALHRLHPTAIAFENFDPLLKRPVRLDIGALMDKLVSARRGGYCYEHNTLFQTALRTLGFPVASLAARVQWNTPPGADTPRHHMLLRIDLPDGPYIADTGFGRLTLTAPLRLVAGIEQPTPHGLYRLVATGPEFQLQAKLGDEWSPLYQLSLQDQAASDWEVANWYTSTHPESRFIQGLMAARCDEHCRYGLYNMDLRIYRDDGMEHRRLRTAQELESVLRAVFRMELPEGSGAVFARLAGSPPE